MKNKIYLLLVEFQDWSIDMQVRDTYKECKKYIKDVNQYGRVEHANIYEIDYKTKTVSGEFIDLRDK